MCDESAAVAGAVQLLCPRGLSHTHGLAGSLSALLLLLQRNTVLANKHANKMSRYGMVFIILKEGTLLTLSGVVYWPIALLLHTVKSN